MKQLLSILFCFAFMISYGQDEQVIIKTPQKPEATPTKVFYSQKVINTKSVEVVKKGVTEFSVAHSFGDIAGDNGGVKRFFGFDNASDIRIGFQTGLSNKLNLVTARTRGGSAILAEWELGLKYQFLKQLDGDPKHPVSLTMYVNDVMSTQKRSTLADQENSFAGFGDRHSQIVQLMLARKFGKVSFQLNPIYLHTDYVVSIDKENMFAIGGAIRLPLSKKIFFFG